MTEKEFLELHKEELESGVIKKVEEGIFWDNKTCSAIFTQG